MDDIITPEDERREQDYKRLRTRNPVCVLCGYDKHPAALELAHIAPKGFHDDGAALCRNCHREISDGEKDYPYSPETNNTKMETIGRYLLALAEWFRGIASTLEGFGQWLLEQAHVLFPSQEEAT